MLLGIFVVYPIIAVVYYSFTDYDIVRPPVCVGLENYQKLLADDDLLAGAASTRSSTCSSRRS